MADQQSLDIAVEPVERVACHHCGSGIDVTGAEPLSIVRCRKCRTLLRVPAKLGDFLLLNCLGRGAAGATYAARDLHLQRDVAIKVIRKTLQGDADVSASVMREARALAALSHPNIVQIFSVAQHDGQPFIVMELVRGEPLSTIVTDSGPLDEPRVLAVAIDVADGLRAACDMGMLHGDIKPANVLISKAGQTKVIDFGLARAAASIQDDKVRGTPNYIAPERALNRPADHRADMFSLGGTLFYVLTGKRPFDGSTVRDVLRARVRQAAPDVRSVQGAISPITAALVARLLERDPQKRYATYDELLVDLEEAADHWRPLHAETVVMPPQSPGADQAAGARRSRRRSTGDPAAVTSTVGHTHGPSAAPPPAHEPLNELATVTDLSAAPGAAGAAGSAPAAPVRRRRRIGRRRSHVDTLAVLVIMGVAIIGLVIFLLGLYSAGVLGVITAIG